MEKPIRILHVFGILERGGAESLIMDIYRNINRKKFQFDFIKHTDVVHSFEEEILSLGGRIYTIPKYRGINHLKYIKSWKVFFDEHPEYQIIHGHMNSTASIYLRIAKRYGLKTIAHSHSTSSGKGISAKVKNILRYRIRSTADYLISCSIGAGKWLFGKNVTNQNNFYILNNSIQTEKFIFDEKIRYSRRKELEINDKIVIGHVGSFGYPKNHAFLIEVFNEYYKANPNSILMLIGEGGLKKDIIEKVNKYNLIENVKFLGLRSDVNELLQVMDIFLMPSVYEGLPVSLIEAQAAGLPIIASNTITDEVKITSLINFMDIKINPLEWAREITYLSLLPRKNMLEEIIQAGYDIKDTTNQLETYYMNIIKGIK